MYVHPGQLFSSSEPVRIETIVGSCVAVCLSDPGLGAGGLAHFVLPQGLTEGPSALRFGRVAVPELIQRLVALGAKRDRLQAKIFGGACVLTPFRNREHHLGAENVRMAEALLAAARIPVVARDVGGERGRKLIFHPDDGRVWSKAV